MKNEVFTISYFVIFESSSNVNDSVLKRIAPVSISISGVNSIFRLNIFEKYSYNFSFILAIILKTFSENIINLKKNYFCFIILIYIL